MKITIAGSEETAALSYRYRRGINKSIDSATILILDKDGAKTQTYLFSLKGFKEVIIEDPTATKVFAGRIRDIATKDLFLPVDCEGWLAQLNDVQIESYDTKEILKSGTTTREATVGSVSGYTIDGCLVGGVNPGWTADQWVPFLPNIYAVVFPDKLGSATRTFLDHCSEAWVAPGTWIQSDHTKSHVKDWDENWNNIATYCVAASAYNVSLVLGLTFQTSIAKSTMSKIDVAVKWGWRWAATGSYPISLQIYDYSTSSWYTLSGYSYTPGIKDEVFTNLDKNKYVSDGGQVKLRISGVNGQSSDITQYVFDFAQVTYYYTGTLIQEIFPITSNGDDHITSSSNFQNAGVCGTDPFVICKMTSEHVRNLVSTYDVQKTIDTVNVTDTDNYRAREWREATALQIISELAEEDQTDFWLDLDQNFYYNQTYGTPSKYINDDDVIKTFTRATMGLAMKNEAHIWGYKYPSPFNTEIHEVRISQSSKDTFGITRTQVERDTSIYTSIDAKSKGDSIVAKNAFPTPQYTLALARKKNADGVVIDIGNCINLNLTKYGSQDLLIVGKAYDPITDETEYIVAQVGSGARMYVVSAIDAIAEIGTRLSRLLIQAGQR